MGYCSFFFFGFIKFSKEVYIIQYFVWTRITNLLEENGDWTRDRLSQLPLLGLFFVCLSVEKTQE